MNTLYTIIRESAARIRPVLFRAALCLSMAAAAATASAQRGRGLPVQGIVTDSEGNALRNVLVDLKESTTFVLTDMKGRFNITVPDRKASLIFTLEGFVPVTALVGDDSELKIILQTETRRKDRTVNLLYGTQKESMITSSVATIGGEKIEQLPVQYQSTALAGMFAGLTVIQNSGQPGSDYSSLYLRGRRSWRHTSTATFLDGYSRDFSAIDPHEIDQISVFKDAGALAVLGLGGSNGAVMVTTKRGREGRPVLKFNAQVGFNQPTILPKFVDSWHFAQLKNEAMQNDNDAAVQMGIREPHETNSFYTEEDMALYLSGESPYTHPNTDWVSENLKNMSVSQRYNLSIEGGSSAAKYYVNISYQNNDGIFKTDKTINSYNTNASSQMYTIRSNVDIALTRTMDLSINLFGRQRLQNNPGDGTNVFNSIYSLPPNIFPVNYGSDMPAGRSDNFVNPYGILNHSGYSQYAHNTMEASAEVRQKLDFITKGLRVSGSMAFDARFDNNIDRSKHYKVYEYLGQDPITGAMQFASYGEIKKQNNSNSFGASKPRNFDLRGGLDYDRSFGRHTVTAMAMFHYLHQSDDTQNLPNIHQGVVGRATYSFASRYIAEFSFGYQGTEQLPPDNRYGFFPAVSAGWILSNESFIRDNGIGKIINFMKFRGSYGLTGNMGAIPYFYYLPAFVKYSTYNLGTNPTNVTTWTESTTKVYNPNTVWETTVKMNAGADMTLFNNHLDITFDYFHEKTSDILSPLSNISTLFGYGANLSAAAFVGEAENRGFEVAAAAKGNIGKFNWTVGGMTGFARSKIIHNEEQPFEDLYRRTIGDPITPSDRYRHVTTGVYTSEQDRLNSPPTTFGNSFAGDIRYRDLNGDGLININDRKRVGIGELGEWNYTLYAGADFAGFDFSISFTGSAGRDLLLSGASVYAFQNAAGAGGTYEGKVTQSHWDNRYNPRDESTWLTATYPRLTVLANSHNFDQDNDFFLYDASYIRLKSLVFGYTLPQRLTQKAFMSKVRVSYVGYNLFTWSKLENADPETGIRYPVQKTSSICLTIHF